MIPMLEAVHRLRARVLPRVQPDPPVRCFVVVCLTGGGPVSLRPLSGADAAIINTAKRIIVFVMFL